MKQISKYFIIVSLLFAISFPAFSQRTSVKGVYHYTLDNGLELYIAENPSVPLTYIELAVKGGGISQTKETVGLFHLYEHMIFKGNSKYQTAAAVQRAINDLGVPSWNGSTGNEYVNYYFTVPSELTYEGLEFWSYAVREPLLDNNEFENEKKVVIAELEGGYSNPSRMYYNALYNFGFPDSPWQFDPGGDVENIKDATLQELIDMKNTYYVPNNTALFVGGDVKHREVYKMVKEIYGDWQKAEDPWVDKDYLVKKAFFDDTIYLVQANPQLSSSIAQVNLFYRGPDSERDINATYVADVFLTLSANPAASFSDTLVNVKELQIPNSNYIGSGYSTVRNGGIMSFSSVLLNPQEDITQRALLFKEVIEDVITPSIVENENYFSQDEYENAKNRLRDSQIYETQTAQGLLGVLRFFWSSTTSDYYFDYLDNLDSVTPEDISLFFEKYVIHKGSILTISVNPQVYESQREVFEDAGFILIDSNNAFWWNNK